MIDISPCHLETVKRILREHVPECEARAFGSRVSRNAKAYSDLDLVVMGGNELEQQRLNRLIEAFEESDLPFRVDVVDWNAMSDSFRKVVEKQFEVVQESDTDGSNVSVRKNTRD